MPLRCEFRVTLQRWKFLIHIGNYRAQCMKAVDVHKSSTLEEWYNSGFVRRMACKLKLTMRLQTQSGEDTGQAGHINRRTSLKSCLLLVTISLYWLHAAAQEGFISLACGSEQWTEFADSSGLLWTSDDKYIQTGVKGQAKTSSSADQTLRYFPNGTKNCYTLDAISGSRYLIRGTFFYANYDGLNKPPKFDVAIDATPVFTVQTSSDPEVHEVIVPTNRNRLSYCLLSTPDAGYPVISKLEMRHLPPQSYDVELTAALKLLTRVDFGSSTPTRYPLDSVDRMWTENSDPSHDLSTARNISREVANLVPDSVLRTSRLADNSTRQFDYIIQTLSKNQSYFVNLYFAEIDPSIQPDDKVFDIYVNGVKKLNNVDVLKYVAQFTGWRIGISIDDVTNLVLKVSLVATSSSREPPSVNALEIFEVTESSRSTSKEDVNAMNTLANLLNMTQLDWSGDPCLPMWNTPRQDREFTSWPGVSCQNLSGVVSITGLNLTNKSLGGDLPKAINNLTNLQNLDLQGNSFSGPLPDLSSLKKLTALDLRSNNFSGEIPSYLLKLPALQTLRVDDNQFSGRIPESSKPNFTFTYSGNLLSNNEDSSRKSSSDKTMQITVGAFVGAAVFVCIIFMSLITYCYRKRQRRLAPFSAFNLDKSHDGPTYIMTTPPRDPAECESPVIDVKKLTLREVETTTRNFQKRIGEGGFGAVYHGNLPDGTSVAVKVRSLTSNQGTREFTAELNFMSKVRHENLVPLIGFCSENQQQILIYPYMSNGSLHDRLYGVGASRKPLDWQTRLNIVLGAARGISFLHTGGPRCIIHRDVKSSNILLDDSMKAKIADFGLSKYSPVDGDSLVSTEVRGTAGYLDPEYYSTQQLTDKSDVFSFGIVLLEVVCGREPLNVQRPRKERSLLQWVRPYIKDANFQPIIDPAIAACYTPESLWRVVETALMSTETQASRRPTMADVVRELEDALIIESNASQYLASIQSLNDVCIHPSGFKPPTAFPLTSPFEPSPVFSDPMALASPLEPSPVFTDTMLPPEPR